MEWARLDLREPRGTGNVDRWGGARLSVEGIRFPETHAYVADVLAKRQEYRDKYAHDLGL